MNKIFIYILLPLILLLVAVSFVMLNLGEKALNNNSTPTPAEQQVEATPTQAQETGTIEGSLSFPSEGIPAGMVVCAETLEGTVVECTNKRIADPIYTYGQGFKLEVPPGEYYVYAQTPELEDYKAYYNEFVVCGLSTECESHELISVEVESGSTTSNVDPQDWYNIAAPTP